MEFLEGSTGQPENCESAHNRRVMRHQTSGDAKAMMNSSTAQHASLRQGEVSQAQQPTADLVLPPTPQTGELRLRA